MQYFSPGLCMTQLLHWYWDIDLGQLSYTLNRMISQHHCLKLWLSPFAFQLWIYLLLIIPEGCEDGYQHLLSVPLYRWHPGQSPHHFAQDLCHESDSGWSQFCPLRIVKIIVLHCQQVLWLSSLASDYYSDIILSEAGLKIWQMRDIILA